MTGLLHSICWFFSPLLMQIRLCSARFCELRVPPFSSFQASDIVRNMSSRKQASQRRCVVALLPQPLRYQSQPNTTNTTKIVAEVKPVTKNPPQKKQQNKTQTKQRPLCQHHIKDHNESHLQKEKDTTPKCLQCDREEWDQDVQGGSLTHIWPLDFPRITISSTATHQSTSDNLNGNQARCNERGAEMMRLDWVQSPVDHWRQMSSARGFKWGGVGVKKKNDRRICALLNKRCTVWNDDRGNDRECRYGLCGNRAAQLGTVKKKPAVSKYDYSSL